MRSRIVATLFALPFFSVGVWMAWSVGSTFHDAWEIRSWVPVQAVVRDAGYRTHAGDDSDTYEVYASYRYQFDGAGYVATRVGLVSGADNIGDYHVDMGSYLSAARRSGRAIQILVDPASPDRALIDPSIRWGLIGFKSIFLLVFGGFGLGLLILTYRRGRPDEVPAEAALDQPWLANEKWRTPVMLSNARSSVYVAWGVAIFWNLVSAPLPFLIYGEVLEKKNYPALIGLLFPLVGIGLVTWAIRRTLEWRRFGATPLTLDPFPGSIGGHVGGSVDLRVAADAAARYSLTLTCIHSYISGSGKNRSRREKAKWQDCQVADVIATAEGSRLQFRFDVPDGLHESDAEQTEDSYYIWRLNMRADLEGTDLNRDFDIPVFATGATSEHASELSINRSRAEQASLDAASIASLLHIAYDAGGPSVFFPAGRNKVSGLVGSIFGAIFFAAGWFLAIQESQWFMGVCFGLVGGLILMFSLYSVLNSLRITRRAGALVAVRRVLGMAVSTKEVRLADINGFGKKSTSQTNSGGQHRMYYKIFAELRDGAKLTIGEGFHGASQADAAILHIAAKFAITAPLRASKKMQKAEENLLGHDA